VILLAARDAGVLVDRTAARHRGSIAGAALTFWMGSRSASRDSSAGCPRNGWWQVRARVKQSGAIALAVLDLIPPPVSVHAIRARRGALEVKARTFFVTLVVCRLLPLRGEAALALVLRRSHRQLVRSDRFQRRRDGVHRACAAAHTAVDRPGDPGTPPGAPTAVI